MYFMNISDEDVNYLAQLSRIHVSPAEVQSLKRDLTNILAYVKQLDEVDIDGVEPTYQVLDLKNVWQEDEVMPAEVMPDELITMPAEMADRQIKVPKVL